MSLEDITKLSDEQRAALVAISRMNRPNAKQRRAMEAIKRAFRARVEAEAA
ncbi:hypothetical protein KIP88_02830 [Bradyrhizobium sp. SRL28]|uniref:hypothetical protein n=1 Tax=Bradyrhizobium sp. SRL28 TaxID=2836178 RepID=UPI001BDEB2FC|nr:hypothetical protein [Bradyrhizobium sp. SRL28]MBT1509426.1 hypothetical protein [Bradyrhizobium sp. SRL28]